MHAELAELYQSPFKTNDMNRGEALRGGRGPVPARLRVTALRGPNLTDALAWASRALVASSRESCAVADAATTLLSSSRMLTAPSAVATMMLLPTSLCVVIVTRDAPRHEDPQYRVSFA